MDTKQYHCDAELESLIRNQNWIETTDARDRLKGKKEFRKSPKSRNLIRFDYINLVVFERNYACRGIGGPTIDETALRLMFWYFNSSTSDKHAISKGHFDLDCARKMHETMTNLTGYAKELNSSNRESKKFERLLANYKSINLNSGPKSDN